MPPDTDPLEDTEDSTAYRWTIRVLYAAGLAMNVWVYWQMSQDDAERAIMRRKVEQAWSRWTKPIREQREWRRNVGRMHWQAIQAVEDPEGADNG